MDPDEMVRRFRESRPGDIVWVKDPETGEEVPHQIPARPPLTPEEQAEMRRQAEASPRQLRLDEEGYFFRGPSGVPCFNFRPYRGEPANRHPDFLRWMLNRDFPADTRRLAAEILRGPRPR